MAGAGFKTFVDGDIFTALEANTYLMQQSVMVFASEAARNSAITSPSEGMFAFTKDADKLWYYDGAAWVETSLAADITGVTAGTGLTGGGTSGSVTLSIDSTVATLTGGQTLTNKTIALGSNTVSGTLAQFNTAVTDADFASLAGSETLTNKTLTTPNINGAILDRTEENWNIVASAATGTINLDVNTASIWYYTSNASANHTLNVRGDGSTTLSSLLAVGDSMTVVWANTNGATPYWPSTFQVDGSTITPKWQGGTAPTGGNASAIDVYTYVIVKTAATPTYTVFASQSQFK